MNWITFLVGYILYLGYVETNVDLPYSQQGVILLRYATFSAQMSELHFARSLMQFLDLTLSFGISPLSILWRSVTDSRVLFCVTLGLSLMGIMKGREGTRGVTAVENGVKEGQGVETHELGRQVSQWLFVMFSCFIYDNLVLVPNTVYLN
jgi:hypothetical protein